MTRAPAPTVTLPAKLKLSTAEFSVLLGALDVDAAPFIEGSDLTTLDKATMYRRLQAARESLLLRELATVSPDKSLAIVPPLRELVVAAVGPKVGLLLMHTRKGQPPLRLYISLAPNGRIAAHTLRSNGDHLLEYLPNPAAIAPLILQVAGVKASTAPTATYALPHAVLAALAQKPPAPDTELLPQLTASGLGPAEAAAMLTAGLRPTQQSVLSSLAIQNGTPAADSLLWFADDQSAWLINRFAQGSQVQLQPATAETLTQAIEGLLQAAMA